MDWIIKENTTLEEKVYCAKLEPGPEVYVLPREGYNKKYAIFSTRFGSIDNYFKVSGNGEETVAVPDGVAHFLEHKLFDNEEGNVFDRFAAYGASPNAFTSFTQTTYLFSCTDFFSQNFKLLLEFVQQPYFTDESVSKEQGIIQQEIRMYQDNPEWRVYFNLLGALYREHPARNDIAGSIESISRIDKDILYRCYYTFYHPRNMAIFATGDISAAEVLEMVQESVSKRSYPTVKGIERIYPREEPAVCEKRVTQQLAVSQPVFNIGFKDDFVMLEGRELLFRELATELLLEMIFARSESLYNELYEEGLIDERFSTGYTAECTYGYTLVGGRTKDPERLHQKVMEGIEKVKREGLSAESFERHKRKVRGAFLRSFNSLEFIANNYLAYRFRGIDFFDILDVLEEVSLPDLERRLHEHLREELHAISIIYPFNEQ